MPATVAKSHGAHYTPPELAARLAGTALSDLARPWGGLLSADVLCSWRICDFACGDGQLLVAARDWLAQRIMAQGPASGAYPDLAAARAVAETRLAGCELRPEAAEVARRRLPRAHIDCADGLAWGPPAPPSLVLLNPPFSSRYSAEVRKRFGLEGRADLAVAFLNRATELAPRVSILATNSIAQGASRRCGIARAVNDGWQIFNAWKDFKWPGQAKVTMVEVHLRKVAPGSA